MFPKVETGKKVPNLTELRKIKPCNKYFVYRVDIEGKLHVTHISLAAILELYEVNKHTMNLSEFLLDSLH